jgi:uncharacterized BrkB/YihY/UPF0761 family membrane protein
LPPVATGQRERSTEHWWNAVADRGAEKVSGVRTRAEETFEQHRDRGPVDVAVRIYERDRDAAGSIVSSAVAFRLFLFFVPLLLFLVGIVGFLGANLEDTDASDAGVGGNIGVQINSALEQHGSTRWIAVGLGLFGMASTGRTLSKTLVSASCLAWRLPMSAKASVKVTGGLVGLIVGVGLVAVGVNRARDALGIAGTGVSLLAAFGIYAVVWLGVGLLLPRATNDPGSLLPGSLLLAGTLMGMQAVSQLYLPGRFDKASQLYGAIGTTVVVLGWFFIIGRAIVLSMTVNAVLYERYGSVSQFVFGLPVVRVLPRRSPKLRRFFGLDEEAGTPEGVDPPPSAGDPGAG